MVKQLDFNLKEKRTRRRLAPECARRMIALLCTHGGWITRRQIMDATGWTDTRMCRLGCEASNSRIIFSNYGYKLMRDATIDEYTAYMGVINKNREIWDNKKYQAEKRFHGLNTMRRLEHGR